MLANKLYGTRPIVRERAGIKPITGINNGIGVFEKRRPCMELPVIRAGKAVFNCQEETRLEFIRVIEVVNRVAT